MRFLLSNQLKVIMFQGNIKDSESNITKDELITVLHYSYECKRSRNAKGIPYGNIHSSELEFILRNFNDKEANRLIGKMKNNETYDFSFLFNSVFDRNKRLIDYEDGFIARGYVIDVEEIFNNYEDGNEILGQRTIKVKLLLSRITYLAEDYELDLLITNN